MYLRNIMKSVLKVEAPYLKVDEKLILDSLFIVFVALYCQRKFPINPVPDLKALK